MLQIPFTANKEFIELYNEYLNDVIKEQLLKIEGIHPTQLDVANMSKKYFTEKLSDVSIDTNANANEDISPSSYASEVTKGIMKLEGYYLLWYYAKKKYGVKIANRLIKRILDGDIYFHDASGYGVQTIYCLAISTQNIMIEGRPYGQLISLPPKRKDSFIAQVIEFVMDVSNQIMGAVAPSDLIINYSWYAKKERDELARSIEMYKLQNKSYSADDPFIMSLNVAYKIESEQIIEYLKTIDNPVKVAEKIMEKDIINDFQKFVHVANNKFRINFQSPFTNISLFDRPNLRKIFENYFFPDGTQIDIEYVIYLEKLFGEFIAKGDPVTGLPYRFPVVTCLTKDTEIFVKKGNFLIKQPVGQIFGSLNEGWTDVDNIKVFDQQGKLINVKKVFKQFKNEQVYKITFKNGYQVTVTGEHKFPTKRGLLSAKELTEDDMVQYNNFTYQLDNYVDKLFVPEFLDNPYIVGVWISNKNKLHEKYNMTKYAFEQLQHRKVFPYYIVKDNNIDISNTRTKDAYDRVKCSIPTYIDIDEDFGYFLGLFIAEGHITDEEVGFSFNINETEYVNFVENYIQNKLGLKVIKRVYEDRHCIQVCTYSSTLGKVLVKLVGKGSTKLRLNDIIYNFPPNVIKAIIHGWLDGDGYTLQANVGNPRIIGTTSSKQLAYDMQALMKIIGIDSIIQETDNARGFEFTDNKLYYVKISSNNNEDLGVENKTYIRNGVFYDKGYIGIKSIELVDYQDYVYDIWVDNEEHLYSLPSGIITHNCNIAVDENKNIIDRDFLNWACKVNLDRGVFNIYVNDGNKIASCCRYVSDFADMKKYRADTFGNGGLNIGSTRVITINLPRLALKANGDYQLFFRLLDEVLEDIRLLHKVHREEILKRRIDAGFIKFIKPLNWIHINNLFATIGINGIYEMTYFMGFDIFTDEGQMFVLDVLKTIEDKSTEYSKTDGWAYNVEEIPGESAAVVFAQKDTLLYEQSDFKLYSNQYIPLIVDASVIDRIKISGKFMNMTSGGGILHLNIEEKLIKPEQMRFLIEKTVEYGVPHFAINYGFGICENNHTSIVGAKPTCPICGSKITDYMTRIIGYFTKVSSWNKVRREYEFKRRKFKKL